MKTFAIYDIGTGVVQSVLSCGDKDLDANVPDGFSAILVEPGTDPHKRVVTGSLVDSPFVPPVLTEEQLRRKEYLELSKDESDEAIWEALDLLDKQGINVGPKAKQRLSDREAIKGKHPKK